MSRVLGDVAVASEGVSKVQKMVNNSGIGSFSLNRVEAIVSLGVGVVEPRKQDAKSAKIAASVVWKQVVRVIAAHEVVPERTDDAARYCKTGHQPNAAVRLYRHGIQNVLELCTIHGVILARERADGRLFRQAEVFAVGEKDVILWHVVTGRIKEERSHYIG